MADSTIVFCVLGVVVVLFVADLVRAEVVALGSAVVLWATGIIDTEQVAAGFGNPTVVFVASLLVVATGLEACGLTAWAGQVLTARAGGSARRLTVSTMLLAAGLTSLVTVHGAVAALIPVTMATALRTGRPASQLLLPLAFAAHAGSQLTLTGSQVNVIFSDAADLAGVGSFGFFEYALVGIPLLVGVIAIVAFWGPRLLPDRAGVDDPVAAHTIELVVPPGSRLVGATVAEPVAVVHHDGDVARRGPIQLAAGDVVLVHGDWHRLASGLDEADALVVDGPSDVRRHAGPWGRGSRRTVAIVAAMVVLLATGALPPVIAGLLAAGALVVSGVLTVDDAYRGVNWTTIVLIGGMIPLSTALTASGAADRIADAITWKVGDAGPYVLLAVLFVVVAGLGQLMSNTATALVVIPVALAAAGDLGVSPRPVLMSVNVVTVAALLTPVATAANAMVQGPGGYRFGDYARLGLPLLGWWFVIAVAWVPFVWRF